MTTPAIPEWVTAVPPSTGVHGPLPNGNQWSGMSENQISQLRGQLLESILSTVVQGIAGLFIPGGFGAAFAQLKAWADGLQEQLADVPVIGDFFEVLTGQEDGDLNDIGTYINAGINAAKKLGQDIIDGIVQFLTGDPNDVNNTVVDLVGALLNPENWLRAVWTALTGMKDSTDADIASIKSQLEEMRQANNDDDLLTKGGYWNCSDPSEFDMVQGALKSRDGAVTSTTDNPAVCHVPIEFGTARQKITVKLTKKREGITRSHICSDTAMTNYVALEWDTTGWRDSVRLVLGGGPTSVTSLLRPNNTEVLVDGSIPTDSVWDLVYDPATNTFYVFKNQVEVRDLRWTDTANLVSHGPTKNRAGFTCDAERDWWDFFDNRKGFWITEVTAYDYLGAVPA